MPASLQSGEDDDDDDDDDESAKAKWLQGIADAMEVLIAPHGKSIDDIKEMSDEEAAKYHLLLSGDRNIAAARIGVIYQQFCVDEPNVVCSKVANTKKEKLGWLISTLRAGLQA